MEKPVESLGKCPLNGNGEFGEATYDLLLLGTKWLAMQPSTGARALGPFVKSVWSEIIICQGLVNHFVVPFLKAVF